MHVKMANQISKNKKLYLLLIILIVLTLFNLLGSSLKGFIRPVMDILKRNRNFHSNYTNEVFPSSLVALNRSTLRPGLVVDWFQDVAVNPTLYHFKWHPSFPYFPVNSKIMTSLTEEEYIKEGFARRIYGYIIPNKSAKYEMEIGSRDGMDMILVETNNSNKDEYFKNFHEQNVLVNLTFTAEEMAKQDKVIQHKEIFKKKISVSLLKGVLYFVDIIQGGGSYGRIDIRWRIKGKNTNYENIMNLYHHKDMLSHEKVRTLHQKILPKYGISENERHRMEYYKIPTLDLNIFLSGVSCGKYLRKRKEIRKYVGVYMTDMWVSYPDTSFGFYGHENKNDVLLNRSEAYHVVDKTFKAIESQVGKSMRLNLQHIVEVQKNRKNNYKELPRKDQFYFVEFDVEVGNKFIPHRVTSYVQLNENDQVCFRNDFVWNAKSKIYIITAVRNLAPWIHYLTHAIDDVMQKTGEKNIELVVVDYDSNDANLTQLLSMHRTPYKYINLKGQFNKVVAINTGLKYIEDDAIGFVLDLHIQLPDNIFDKIRKQTLKGISAFGPTVLKFGQGHHEQYTEMHNSNINNDWVWVDNGYGLMAMYKSDWDIVGGMNEKLFSTKWGGEDWEFIDRLLGNGYYLFHWRYPRLYHIYHSKKKMWNAS